MALQMTWQPHLHRRKKGGPIGLKNLGNSCYLNSVLQCLTYTPPLANFCLTNQHSSLCGLSGSGDCPFCVLERRIVQSLSIDVSVDDPSKIHKSLRIFAKHFRCGYQEDAHEFLRYVIDACHDCCMKVMKERKMHSGVESVSDATDTVVKEIFGGALQSEVKCLSCGAESRKTDEIMDLSLDLSQTSSLKDALRRFFQAEVLDGGNKYNCEKCKKLSAARKQMSVLRAPNILVIQLKRFEGILGLKIDRPIVFEEGLTLSSYMCKASQDPHPEYSLFGTIVHSGFSPESGHYYAYIKDVIGRWYCCNDSYVTLSTLQEVLSEKVYILFFSRKNSRPRPSRSVLPHNVKKSSVLNGDFSVKKKEIASLRPPASKANGVHQPVKDSPVVSKLDKGPSDSVVKFDFKKPGLRKNAVNGNGNLKLHNDSSIMKHGDMERLMSPEKLNLCLKPTEESRVNGKQTVQSTFNGGSSEDKSSDFVKSESKQTLLPAGKSETEDTIYNLEKVADHEENVTGEAEVDRKSDLDQANAVIPVKSDYTSQKGSDGCPVDSSIPACKRKSPNSEAIDVTHIDFGNSFELSATSDERLMKFTKMLAGEATSVLHSCGWVNDVHNFMHLRKKLRTQIVGNVPKATELKKLLIADAKVFISRLPESLKEYLIGRLRSFTQGKKSLEA